MRLFQALRAMGTARPAAAAPVRGNWYRREETIMGSAIRVELWSEYGRQAEAALTAVMQEMHRVDRAMSPYKLQSELSRINRDAASMEVLLSEEMFDLIERSIQFSELSDGAFDISYAGVGHLYDYRAGIQPSAAALERACAAVGYRQLLLDPRSRTLRFGRSGMRIGLGGFAKGHAVDRSVAILARMGIAHALVSAGNDSRALGDRRGQPWSIAVRDPRRAGEVLAVLPLEDAAISTSGDYQRYFERDGVRHHQLIDPHTGRSPSHIRSVTVLAGDGLTTEGLSKSVFVLGLQRGLQLVDSLPDVDAIVVDGAGRLHYSSGLLAAGAQRLQ